MLQMTLAEISQLLNLPAPSLPHLTCQGISIDSRSLEPQNLFFAIPGPRVDGHDFLAEAAQKGAIAAVVNRPMDTALPQLIVTDTTKALGTLASHWRDRFSLPCVAITGSNGKTTLKNMLAAIMTAACHGNPEQVLATVGTLNNEFGLPLTLARLNQNHRYAAIEMGMNHFGEIDYLTRLTKPTVAVINNAAACHLEGVGDIAGVAKAKAEIFAGLAPTGIAILNRDDDFFNFWRELIGNRTFITFGYHADADVAPIKTHQQYLALRTPKGHIEIELPLLGEHNCHNALAAVASALAINIPLDAIKSGLEKVTPAKGRLQLHTLANGVNIIDDTYNANPFSLEAAVKTLASFSGKKILVLGDMKELGHEAKLIHQTAGEKIRAAGIDYLFTYGELSANAAQVFGEGAYHFNEQEKLVNALKPFLYNQTTILVKGSRSMKMEKVIEGLCHPI
jgi:UDP-N-acetylmuramoyl-tripeptide--D-alanyl-D-alanine ligase